MEIKVQEEENRYREMYAKSRTSKVLQDEFLMMVPVFKNLDSFKLRAVTTEEVI